MCDQDDFDFDEVEEEKGVCDNKRPEVIEKARLRRVQLKQHKTLLPATVNEVSYDASYF